MFRVYSNISKSSGEFNGSQSDLSSAIEVSSKKSRIAPVQLFCFESKKRIEHNRKEKHILFYKPGKKVEGRGKGEITRRGEIGVNGVDSNGVFEARMDAEKLEGHDNGPESKIERIEFVSIIGFITSLLPETLPDKLD